MMNSPLLFARPLSKTGAGRGELALRYAAAAAVTLIALAAAQLVVPTSFVLWMVAITLLGLPFSLWLRAHDGRALGLGVPRPLWNAATVMAAGVASFYFLRSPLSVVWDAVSSGSAEAFLQMGQTEPMILLVQLFLIFAAFRSWTLLSDKDATLATVPSFSVLLLLIPIHRSVEVVCYFLLWTVAATTLFALEHRSEVRALVVASVPAPAPGQDVKLAARSLAGVLGISLAAAIALSGFLTSRDPSDGSGAESAVAQMASRWTQWSMGVMNGSSASGPERQIDFSSPNSVPTRAVLWAGSAIAAGGRSIQPTYWRLFALSNYDGAAWTQSGDSAKTVERVQLSPAQWPLRELLGLPSPERNDSNRPTFAVRPRRDRSNRERNGREARDEQPSGRPSPEGFPVASIWPDVPGDFGAPRALVGYRMAAQRPNLGFVPLLSLPLSVAPRGGDQNSVQVRHDGSVDMNVTNVGQGYVALSRVFEAPGNGLPGAGPPRRQIALRADAPQLSASERALNLKLPAMLPARVRQLARNTLRGAAPDASNFARAQLLAATTQRGSIYTLRPPTIPDGREAADFFLFESRRGYCTYYAGALAVLCRSAGIPARVVSGFAIPPLEAGGDIVLRDANAHAWTEIWIENWGWATVDATPSDDRGDNAPTFLENWGDLSASKLDVALRYVQSHWPRLAGGIALLALALALWRARHRVRRRLRPDSALENEAQRREIALTYRAATRELNRRFRPRAAWETPDEWLLAARAALPQLPYEPLQRLTALYVRAHFSPRPLEAGAARQARQARESVIWAKGAGAKRKVGAS